MNQQYYTADEAMKKLGLPKTSFYRLINEGEIPYELPGGRKRGRLFPREAIDLHARLAKQQQTPTEFAKTTKAELWTRIQHGIRIYGPDDITPYSQALSWLSRNSEIFMSLRQNGELVGGATIVPIDEPVLLRLIEDEIRERDIPLEAVKPWTDNNLTAYIATLAVYPQEKRGELGAALIRHVVKWAVDLQARYDIAKWYAIGATDEGQAILEWMGFERIGNNPNRLGYILSPSRHKARYIEQLVDKMGEK